MLNGRAMYRCFRRSAMAGSSSSPCPINKRAGSGFPGGIMNTGEEPGKRTQQNTRPLNNSFPLFVNLIGRMVASPCISRNITLVVLPCTKGQAMSRLHDQGLRDFPTCYRHLNLLVKMPVRLDSRTRIRNSACNKNVTCLRCAGAIHCRRGSA
jgi:hypothetical protein